VLALAQGVYIVSGIKTEQRGMIILKSLLSTFEANYIFWQLGQ